MPAASKPYFRIPWVGLEIERRTDFLAMAAFILALMGTLYQVFGYFKGSEVKLFPPPQVLMISAANSAGDQIIRMHARMAFVNSGEPGYHASISLMNVNFQFSGTRYEQFWQLFQSYDNDKDTLVPHYVSDARPFPVNAGSAVSHEILFAPHPIRCRNQSKDCDKWKNVIYSSKFFQGLEQIDTLTFTFTAEVFGETQVSTTCIVDIDNDVRDNLVLNGWAAPRCWPTVSS